MTCPQCVGIEREFGEKTAARELHQYHKNGPSNSTRLLIETLANLGIQDKTLLDIGGGIGVIQHELLKKGLARSISVDASSAYAAAARKEAQSQGFEERTEYIHGDFVDLASKVAEADIVTLDKVICCYDDMRALVSASASKAKDYYGVVFPYDTWWVKAAFKILNLFLAIIGNPFRTFVHPTSSVEEILTAKNLERTSYSRSGILGFWQVIVYTRL